MIYIIGHIKPDLDSAVSTIALKYLFDHADCFGYKNSQPVLAGPANFETKTIFKKFKTPAPQVLKTKNIKSKDSFILSDHNEESQRLQGIKPEKIIDIYDHHKVNLDLPKPIFINIKPWGSTCTIIYWFMEITNVKPSKNLASIMISAILSDTQGFKSKTTTKKDKIAVIELNKLAKIKNIDKLTHEIFKAKSDITGLTNKQIITKDYKLYNFAGKKALISQIETVKQDKLINQSVQLIKELVNLKKEMKLDKAFCIITDILKVNSKCFVLPEDEAILVKAFPQAKKIKSGVYDIGLIMSRKKEIAPAIEKTIHSSYGKQK